MFDLCFSMSCSAYFALQCTVIEIKQILIIKIPEHFIFVLSVNAFPSLFFFQFN